MHQKNDKLLLNSYLYLKFLDLGLHEESGEEIFPTDCKSSL